MRFVSAVFAFVVPLVASLLCPREKVKAAMTSAHVTPEEVETVSEYDAYVASRCAVM